MSSVSQRKRTSAKTDITLRGSTEIVTDFFYYAVNSILYQRGIYHPDSFIREAKYDIITLVTTDEGLKNYLQNVIEQLKGWLMDSELQRLVLVVVGKDSGETLERWTFSVHKEDQVVSDKSSEPQAMMKSKKDVTRQIKEVIRQITASVTFLPMIDEPCSFDLLVYTDDDAKVPTGWDESDPKCIEDSSEVKLRSFSTKIHKVDTVVSYKTRPDEL